ncbi:phage BR0599 family protein [Fulvimonas yonginensis]|uniref:Phage BR0599 family protein n=1 Tax=Fulvimonas yonginensis TaxID=1495200 RepID=A0ABU8JB02_9GAMM
MTSEARDAALLGGQPLKLFRFTRANLSWFYTNADRAITYNGDTYLPTAISHDKIKDGGDSQQRTIKISLPKDLEVAANWRPYPPADPIMVTIWTQHVGEVDYLVDWIGRLTSPQFDDTKLILSSEPSQTRNKRGGRSRIWQRPCDLVLFSQGNGLCNVDRAAHALPATLTAVDGLSLTAAEFANVPNGRLAGGWIEWPRSDGLIERRSINSHSGTTIVVTYGAADLAPNLAVTAYPGCSGSWADCAYFNNTPNFGGELWIPGRDYYDGNPI